MFVRPFKLSRRVKALTTRTRLELFLFTLMISVGIASSLIFFKHHIEHVNTEVSETHETTVKLFRQFLEADAVGLARAITALSSNQTLLEKMQSGQRDAIYAEFEDDFERLKNQTNITHGYFIDPNGDVLLRAHKPDQFGDRLSRTTYLKSARTQKLACGIEMGMNFYSLRCVQPVYLGESHEFIGYIELAEEIDHIFHELKEATGNDLAILLVDDFITFSEADIQGQEFSHYQLIYSTDSSLMETILPKVNLDAGFISTANSFITDKDEKYGIGVSPFEDITGQISGVLVSVENITQLYKSAINELWINVVGALFIILLTIILFSIAIKRAFKAMEEALDERTCQIEFMALHDELTQLPNRAMFCKMVQHQINEAKRYDRQFSLLFMDLDGFKAVNDNLGHDAGDELLRQVAERLNLSIRDSDVASRIGGDEFIVLLPEISGEEEHKHVDVVAGRILNAIAAPFMLKDQVIHITASIGISCYPEHGDNEDELTKHADAAMYAAKESGKNGIQRYSAELHKQSFERRALEADLKNAIHNHEFEMFYQAKLDSQSVEVIGMEALIRWHHPNLGLVEPADFISIAEDTGLIIPIGKWVIETACRQNMQWLKNGNKLLPIAVNLSPKQFNDERLLEDILKILSETQMPAEYLVVEITERVVVEDAVNANKVLRALKELGVGLAIDDLGVGYSSFSSLEIFPVDSVKIDRSFIHGLPENQSNSAITEAIINMADRLGLNVIAEGVETSEQLEFLRKYQCPQLQGFYFNKPMPADEFEKYLNNSKQRLA